MNIILNGEKYEISKDSITVEELLNELSVKWNIDLSGAVVLVNDEIVKKNLVVDCLQEQENLLIKI